MSKGLSINDCLYKCMQDGRWWTFWDLQAIIKEKAGKFYGEPSISAGIRDFRKMPFRLKYDLPLTAEVVERKRITGGKGYKYRLVRRENVTDRK